MSTESLAEGVEGKDLHADFIFAIRLQEALRDFASSQTEILRLSSYMDDRATEIDSASQRARDILTEQLEDINEAAITDLVGFFENLDDMEQETDGLAPEEMSEAIAKALDEITEVLPDGQITTYMESVLRAISAPPGVDILRSSLLVSLVGGLEMLIDSIARASYELKPHVLNRNAKQFTWSEISSFDSIADLRDYAVDILIEDVMRGSLSKWVGHFKKEFDIPKIEVVETFAAQEVIQRRHCIAHNAGIASSSYVDKLSQYGSAVPAGTTLEVTSEYLRQAADTLFHIAYALIWALGFKLTKDREAVGHLESVLADRTYYLLRERRYDLIKDLGASEPWTRIEESPGFVMRVNYWLAFKLSGDFESVVEEVRGLDVSTRSREFHLAKYALLDQHKEAYELAQKLISDEELRPAHFYTWPLLAGARDYSRSLDSEQTGSSL